MNRALQIAHLALLLCAAGLCVSGGLFLWQAKATATSLRTAAVKYGDAADQLSATLATINRPCGSGHPCGTLSDIAKTLATVRGTAGQVEVAARHETKRIDVWDAQEAQLAADTHKLLTNGSEAIQSAKATIDNLQPAEAELEVELRQTQRATAAITNLAMDPNLRQMAKNLNEASSHANVALGNVADTTGDVKQAVHSYLHPKWPTKVWHAVSNGLVEGAKFFF